MDNSNFLTVAPFECAWTEDLRFPESGRGCVAFEAFAQNDITVVFREEVGTKHYHYKRDTGRHYTVIIGSHRNRRLKIEVDGRTKVDEARIGLCCSSGFQGYWVSVCDGLICIGKGTCPFQNTIFRWRDSNPNRSVRYVGLCGWDKHIGYRNVNVFPIKGNDSVDGYFEKPGLEKFLERWEFSDIVFIVGDEGKHVPSHKVILQSCGNFCGFHTDTAIHLEDFSYTVLHALLLYIYRGSTRVSEWELASLRALSYRFGVRPLVNQCDEALELSNSDPLDSGKSVDIFYERSGLFSFSPFGTPVDVQKLNEFYRTGEHADMDIIVSGHGLVARPHKLVLSSWSFPFMKMLTNGMRESVSSTVNLKEVSPETVKLMLEFMYRGRLDDAMEDDESLCRILQLLLLADQFRITLLHNECCALILQTLSEDTVCMILEAVSRLSSSCEVIEEMCKKKFAMNFDYCTTEKIDFVDLDRDTFSSVLQHSDLRVTSEERVLEAVLWWCMEERDPSLSDWRGVDLLLRCSSPEVVFGKRYRSMDALLQFVRFPIMPYTLLTQLKGSSLSCKISTFRGLVAEAIDGYDDGDDDDDDVRERFEHRRSGYKELQYICDGDSNGVMYYAGTSYGKHPWLNPVILKRVFITASSPSSRHTDPKLLVSRSYRGTSYAGRCMEEEGGRRCAWWAVDLGEDHRLMCNYYTLRQDGSRTFLTSWSLQASIDGRTWTDLRVHSDDPTICEPAQFASWPVPGRAALLPFRYFRILTASHSHLSICFLELYGYFR